MTKKNLLLVVVLLLWITSPLLAQDYKYIGAAKCKMCHNSEKSGQQFSIWSKSPHANALKSLGNAKSLEYAKKNNIADPTKEQKCLKCHSTAASVNAKSIESLTATEGVSCESCHGPGSAYKTVHGKDKAKALKSGMIEPTQKVCETCHNKENPFHKPFDYKKSVAKIAHPTPKS